MTPENSYRAKLSIFISAYNEEENIRPLLQHILAQKGDTFVINDVLVISDGSTDCTVDEVRKVGDPRIRIIQSKRIGKSAHLNYFFETAQGDILVFFDGDIRLDSVYTIAKLIRPLRAEPAVGLVGGNAQQTPGRTFVEHAINLTCSVFDELRVVHRGGNNAFGANGCIMALSHSFAQKVRVPEDMIANDQFLYFSCVTSGFKFVHERSAVAWYRSPSTLGDHVRQNTRFMASRRRMERIFGERAREEYALAPEVMRRLKLRAFLKKPLHALAIRIINLYCEFAARKREAKMDAKWLMAPTTKEVIYDK